MFRCRAIAFAVLICGSPAASQAASTCDPLDFHDKTVAFKDVQTRLLYAEDVAQGRTRAGSGAGLDFFDVAGLDGTARTTYAEHLKQLAHIDFKESDRRFLYMSEMSDGERAGYLACLSQQNVLLAPSAGAARFRRFSVQLSLRNSSKAGAVPITVAVTGASIASITPGRWTFADGHRQASGHMAPGAEAQVSVSRDRGKRFAMTASAGSEHDSLTLPAPPTRTLIEETRYSPRLESHCNECRGGSPQPGTLTIAVPNDELIKPRSESVESFSAGSAPAFSPRTGGVYAGLDVAAYSQKYNPHDLHVTVSVASAAAPAPWCAVWVAAAKVFVAVPGDATSSGRQKPKPETACHLP